MTDKERTALPEEPICLGGWRQTDDEGVARDWNHDRTQLWQERFPNGTELHWNEHGGPAMVKIPAMKIVWDPSGNVRWTKNATEFIEAAFYTALEARQEEMRRDNGGNRDDIFQPAPETHL